MARSGVVELVQVDVIRFTQTELFLMHGSNKKWCHLTDSMELQVTLPLEVVISDDCVWTQTTNGLALF